MSNCKKNVHIAYPQNVPVISLRQLVDSRIFRYCRSQSRNIKAQKAAKTTAGKESILQRITAIHCPINTPVQRAHTGN